MPSPNTKIAVGIYLAAGLIIVLISIFNSFPSVYNGVWITNRFYSSAQSNLFSLVLLFGGLGSYIHLLSSYASYVGNRRFVDSWGWWYFFKPFIGMSIALTFFLLVNAGILPLEKAGTAKELYWALSVAVLVGIFNDKAMIKLEEVFDIIFKPSDNRADKLVQSQMIILITNPAALSRSTLGALKVIGQKFPPDAVVLINGQKQTITNRVTDTEIHLAQIDNVAVHANATTIELRLTSESLKQESKRFDIKIVNP